MVWVTLPTFERAEQDVAGRHTARRPSSWARPGLGYRVEEAENRDGGGRRRSLTGLLHRYVLPRAVSRHLAARREAGRIDYRIGHLPPVERAATVRALAADGLGAHTASLTAVATYEDDADVLDALAEAIAARQWEPVSNDRIAALRLWARGWLYSRRLATTDTEADGAVVNVVRTTPPVPLPEPRAVGPPPVPTHPRSFARPAPGGTSFPEDDR